MHACVRVRVLLAVEERGKVDFIALPRELFAETAKVDETQAVRFLTLLLFDFLLPTCALYRSQFLIDYSC